MTTPVPLVLTLWSLGHSSSDIATRIGIHRRGVENIVAHARKINDPRAVVHLSTHGAPTGNIDHVKGVLIKRPALELVPLIGMTVCKRGHAMTKENTGKQTAGVRCLACHYMRNRSYRKKK